MLRHEEIEREAQIAAIKDTVAREGPLREGMARFLARGLTELGRPCVVARVCSCGAVVSEASFPGHLGGSNRAWTVKARTRKGKRFAPKHHAVGWAILPE